jgi:hypothetical protein
MIEYYFFSQCSKKPTVCFFCSKWSNNNKVQTLTLHKCIFKKECGLFVYLKIILLKRPEEIVWCYNPSKNAENTGRKLTSGRE